jgi:uncharacterized protein (TIGR00645 family)
MQLEEPARRMVLVENTVIILKVERAKPRVGIVGAKELRGMKLFIKNCEDIFMGCRWILALFFAALVPVILLLGVKFYFLLEYLFEVTWHQKIDEFTPTVLGLLDITLLAALLLMVAYSGFMNFVSKLDFPKSDHLDWLKHVEFSDLKIKLMGIMVVITGIGLLETIMRSDGHLDSKELFWKVIIHLVFVVSGVLFAHTEKLSSNEPSRAPAESATSQVPYQNGGTRRRRKALIGKATDPNRHPSPGDFKKSHA